MKLWCYGADAGEWGQQLYTAAKRRGVDAEVFVDVHPDMQQGDYAFMRIPQWEPGLTAGKKLATQLRDRGLLLIPDQFTIQSYENKIMQSQAYSRWMPKTHIIRKQENTMREALLFASGLGYPFISKSDKGSASANVRLITSIPAARSEYERAMGGRGIQMKTGPVRVGLQKGYLIWQKFCENNKHDYRVIIVGRRVMMLQRDNRPDTSFASGSGLCHPVIEPDTVELGVLDKAIQFFTEYGLRWCGIDLVYDADDGEWKILETTLGWTLSSYLNCPFFETTYRGEDIFELLLDEIEAGVFE